MEPRNNPFRAGAGVRPPYLVGREPLVEAAHVAIDITKAKGNGRPTLISGLRGVGKTVLLNRFRSIAEDAGFAAVVLEASESGEFLRVLARETQALVHGLVRSGTVTERIKQAVGAIRGFSVTYGLSGTIDFKIEVGAGELEAMTADPEMDVRALLTHVGKAAQERKTGVFLGIDEMQYLTKDELAAVIATVHRLGQLELPVYITGAGLPNLPTLAAEAKTYAERLFTFPRLDRLSPEEVCEALQVPAREAGATFDEDALESIATITRGYPYFVQEWGHDAWNLASGKNITNEDVQAASTLVLQRLDEDFFRVRLSRATDTELKYLRGMADLGDGPQGSGAIAAAGGFSPSAGANVRERLIQKGIVYSPGYGHTEFSVPLFGEYLQRAFPSGMARPTGRRR